ncbi:unnamed protein product [Chondrus crispus]|uniref:Uncharacterized protein n=1 Tax=Chondrus crispus TaxID=2769 RepID=R7QEB8_CHOCR|nr:unnamed protein product [Chondrus crispus]CDF35775.1 unnamed protein product [Chondrus crispus]|eukprot:XP_005715594.1 unnamed protein product [Chondrus crispus]
MYTCSRCTGTARHITSLPLTLCIDGRRRRAQSDIQSSSRCDSASLSFHSAAYGDFNV